MEYEYEQTIYIRRYYYKYIHTPTTPKQHYSGINTLIKDTINTLKDIYYYLRVLNLLKLELFHTR